MLLLLLQFLFVFLAQHSEGEARGLLAGLLQGGLRLGRACLAACVGRAGAGAATILSAGLRCLDVPPILSGMILDIDYVRIRGREARVHL